MNIDGMRELSPYTLASDNYANCLTPDSQTSHGATMLIDIRDRIVERIETTQDITADDLRDAIGELLDSVVDYRTWQKWQQFTDLGAWQEEPESGEWGSTDFDKMADEALGQIADRCAYALIAAWEESAEETGSE